VTNDAPSHTHPFLVEICKHRRIPRCAPLEPRSNDLGALIEPVNRELRLEWGNPTAPPGIPLELLDGTEIRLYDPKRKPQDWTDLIDPADCVVFLKDRADSTSLAPHGRPYPKPSDETCVVFRSLEAAQQFGEAIVEHLPHVRCEIYDAEGPANRPLLVIVHPEFRSSEESGPIGSRHRRLMMFVLVLSSIPLFWLGAHGTSSSDLAIFFGINCLLLALRFLYWDAGWKASERKRLARLESHRKLERGDA
jgi:hypothetical protein